MSPLRTAAYGRHPFALQRQQLSVVPPGDLVPLHLSTCDLGEMASLSRGDLAVASQRHADPSAASSAELVLQEEGLHPRRGDPDAETMEFFIENQQVAPAWWTGEVVDLPLVQPHRPALRNTATASRRRLGSGEHGRQPPRGAVLPTLEHREHRRHG